MWHKHTYMHTQQLQSLHATLPHTTVTPIVHLFVCLLCISSSFYFRCSDHFRFSSSFRLFFYTQTTIPESDDWGYSIGIVLRRNGANDINYLFFSTIPVQFAIGFDNGSEIDFSLWSHNLIIFCGEKCFCFVCFFFFFFVMCQFYCVPVHQLSWIHRPLNVQNCNYWIGGVIWNKNCDLKVNINTINSESRRRTV